jgi:hypothetical protein
MTPRFVLDAWAMLALLQGEEPAARSPGPSRLRPSDIKAPISAEKRKTYAARRAAGLAGPGPRPALFGYRPGQPRRGLICPARSSIGMQPSLSSWSSTRTRSLPLKRVSKIAS